MGIEGHGLHIQNPQVLPKEKGHGSETLPKLFSTERVAEVNTAFIPDKIIHVDKRTRFSEAKHGRASSNPNLKEPSSGDKGNLNDHLNKAIQENRLPKGSDLANKVSKETSDKIDKVLNKLENSQISSVEMKRFFTMLSKLYPVSLTLLSSMFGSNNTELSKNFTESMFNTLAELADSMSASIDNLDTSPEMKAQLKGVSEQLLNLVKLSGKNEQSNDQVNKLLLTMQTLSGKGAASSGADPAQNFLQKADLFLSIFKNLNSLPESSRNLALSTQLAHQGIQLSKSDAGLLGPTIDTFSDNMGKFIAEILESSATSSQEMGDGELSTLNSTNAAENAESSQNAESSTTLNVADSAEGSTTLAEETSSGKQENSLSSQNLNRTEIAENSANLAKASMKGKEGHEFYANAFKQVILSGTLLGHMIVSKGEKEASRENIELSSLKLNSSKDLGITDQIPFSFLAFFPNLRSDDDDYTDPVKMAKQSVLNLIRILLKLIFVLVAIATGGQKLGKEGMDQLLKENTEFITSMLDNLIFALKKVDEHYVVNVNFHTALAQESKTALALSDYDHFWNSIIHMFAPESELASFLKDMEDAQPLFKTIKSLMEESDIAVPLNISS